MVESESRFLFGSTGCTLRSMKTSALSSRGDIGEASPKKNFVIVAGIFVLNRVRYPFLFSPTATVLVVVVALVGAGGAVYFARRLVRRG